MKKLYLFFLAIIFLHSHKNSLCMLKISIPKHNIKEENILPKEDMTKKTLGVSNKELESLKKSCSINIALMKELEQSPDSPKKSPKRIYHPDFFQGLNKGSKSE